MNTKFFHLSVINRPKQNKISYFKNNNDNWKNEPMKVSDHALAYFSNCFMTNHSSTSWTHLKYSSSSLHKLDLTALVADFEITNVVFSFNSFKAPGPDDLHPYFFQFQWNLVGNLVRNMCHTVFNAQSLPHFINYTLFLSYSKFF